MSLVVVCVACSAASAERCFAPEIVAAAEEYVAPLSWHITVSPSDPMGNAGIYRNEYLHRIPSWHEFGLAVDLSQAGGKPKARADLFRLAKEVLKQCHIKPTSCLLRGEGLSSQDIHALSGAGILVAAVWPHAVLQVDAEAAGSMLVARVAGTDTMSAELGQNWASIEPILARSIAEDSVTIAVVRDDKNEVPGLRRLLELTRSSRARIGTLTSVAAERAARPVA